MKILINIAIAILIFIDTSNLCMANPVDASSCVIPKLCVLNTPLSEALTLSVDYLKRENDTNIEIFVSPLVIFKVYTSKVSVVATNITLNSLIKILSYESATRIKFDVQQGRLLIMDEPRELVGHVNQTIPLDDSLISNLGLAVNPDRNDILKKLQELGLKTNANFKIDFAPDMRNIIFSGTDEEIEKADTAIGIVDSNTEFVVNLKFCNILLRPVLVNHCGHFQMFSLAFCAFTGNITNGLALNGIIKCVMPAFCSKFLRAKIPCWNCP